MIAHARQQRLQALATTPARAPGEAVGPDAWAAMTDAMRRDHLADLGDDRAFALAQAVAADAGRTIWDVITEWHAQGLIGPQSR